ncbi:MAG: GNAT family N-acetyltransferase [Actinobacteria bacterium]|nr:GNAT family N-acetyltransferase [Actinomycetota bacterium]
MSRIPPESVTCAAVTIRRWHIADAAALNEAGFSVDGIEALEIVHDAANTASARVPHRVGFIRVADMPVEPSAPGEVGIDVTWRLHRPL